MSRREVWIIETKQNATGRYEPIPGTNDDTEYGAILKVHMFDRSCERVVRYVPAPARKPKKRGKSK